MAPALLAAVVVIGSALLLARLGVVGSDLVGTAAQVAAVGTLLWGLFLSGKQDGRYAWITTEQMGLGQQLLISALLFLVILLVVSFLWAAVAPAESTLP